MIVYAVVVTTNGVHPLEPFEAADAFEAGRGFRDTLASAEHVAFRTEEGSLAVPVSQIVEIVVRATVHTDPSRNPPLELPPRPLPERRGRPRKDAAPVAVPYDGASIDF